MRAGRARAGMRSEAATSAAAASDGRAAAGAKDIKVGSDQAVAESCQVLAAVRARLHELHAADAAPASAGGGAPDAVVHVQVTNGASKSKGSNKGLSYFSRQVAEHMAVIRRTTYLDLADMLVAQAKTAAPGEGAAASSGARASDVDDEKNIRRRVYDAVNVLRAIGAIRSNESKDIIWVGLPTKGGGGAAAAADPRAAAARRAKMERLDAKQAYLMELVNQQQALEGLVARNRGRERQGAVPEEGRISLPFMVACVPSQPCPSVDVRISDAQDCALFDFAESPFQMHDDSFVLSRLRLDAGSSGRPHAWGSSPGAHHPAVHPCQHRLPSDSQ